MTDLNNWKCSTSRTNDFQTYEHEINYDNFTIKFTEKNDNILSAFCIPKTKESLDVLYSYLQRYKDSHKKL